MSTSYHINIRSLVLKALVSPAESLSLLVLWDLKVAQRTSTLSVFSGPAGAFSTREL